MNIKTILSVISLCALISIATPAEALFYASFLGAEQKTEVQYTPNTRAYRVAKRLRRRMKKRFDTDLSVFEIAQAVKTRQDYLSKAAYATITLPDGSEAYWPISLHRYPSWLRSTISKDAISYSLDTNAIETTLEEDHLVGLKRPSKSIVHDIGRGNVLKAITSSPATPGIDVSVEQTLPLILQAFNEDVSTFAVHAYNAPGKILNASAYDLGELQYLGGGQSNFAGSSWGRRHNVHKAMDEHVHNILVAPGDEFSFNNTLEGPVTTTNGWSMAKVIFGGSELKTAPGGGICQASTTVYRAMLNAGLPVGERKAHSLYVSYYEEYGVGIDATIFPGKQDLTFTNDTDDYLLIQAYTDEYDNAVVHFYGKPDGRSVELQGPYFAQNAPDDLQIHGRSIYHNEIAWKQVVTKSDGTVQENTIVSRYRTIPYSVVQKHIYAQTHELNETAMLQ